jgi:hypothetical protein
LGYISKNAEGVVIQFLERGGERTQFGPTEMVKRKYLLQIHSKDFFPMVYI